MCGIGGILFPASGEERLRQRLRRMEQAQGHRGPDDRQVVILNDHGFCHQRLSLVDREGGAQPLSDPTRRYLIVYNGEVYNYRELRKELEKDYAFRTQSDTEVVLAAYIRWGARCLEKFTGMFAFLIWDMVGETGFAARDPLGVKPFVYYLNGQEFIFASESKAILAALDRKPSISAFALAEFVIAPYFSGVRNAALEGLCYLHPGECLRIRKEGIKKEIYYNYLIHGRASGADKYISGLRDALRESVALSLRADVPVCSFLSGGLDSSVLTSLAVKQGAKDFKSYTILFEDHPHIIFDPATIVNSDDYPFAARLSETLGIPLERVAAKQEALLTALRKISCINDRIPAWEQELSQHFLSAAASREYKAVLVGDAADETHFGYFFLLNDEVNHSPAGILNRFGGIKRASLLSENMVKEGNPLLLLEQEYRDLAERSGFSFKGRREDRILATSCLIYKLWLPRLLHNGDIHTMHHGLEARVPFANSNLLQLTSSSGPALGFYNEQEKYALKEAVKGWIPEEIRQRKKSSLPRDPRLGHAFQRILKQLASEEKDFTEYYFNSKALANLCEQPQVEEADRMILFNLVCLLYWYQHYGK